MSNVRLLILIPFLCACAANRSAVNTAKPTNNKSVVAETVAVDSEDFAVQSDDAVVEVAFEEPQSIPSSAASSYPEPLKSIQFNPKYAVSNSINDRYDFYWEKNANNRYNAQGVVDKDGNVILPNLFTRGSSPNNNFELVLSINNLNSGLYNLNELRWTIPPIYHEIYSLGNNVYSAKKDNKWGLIDNNDMEIGPFAWKQIERIYNLENYLMVSLNDMWGIYSIVEKKLTVPTDYAHIKKLERENYFVVRKGTKQNVIDINNKPLFKEWYDEVRSSSMNTDYFIVKLNNKYGVIDHSEKVIIPLTYLEFGETNYSDGSYLARNKDGKYGFMLIDGRVTLPFNYDNVKKGYNNNIISIQSGKCGLVRVNSGLPTEIVTCEFDNITEGAKTFIVEKGGKFGLLNQYGKPITEIEYTGLESLKDSYYDEVVLYLGQKGKFFYLLNEQGKAMNEAEFLDLSPLIRKSTNSYYASPRYLYLKFKAKNGKMGLVDKVGKVILQPQFDDIVSEDDNIIVVKSNKKCGLYSLLAQKMIVEPDYDLVIRSNNNYLGFSAQHIDLLSVKSDQVKKTAITSK
jgi:hypothetical protein